MSNTASAASLVLAARTGAGLSQRHLAMRAGTAQSVVARIEAGQTDPGLKTLQRLLAAAGYGLAASVELNPVMDSHMLDDVRRILALSPEDRLIEIRNIHSFVSAARRG